MKKQFLSHSKQLELTSQQSELLIPIIDVCWELLEKAYEYRLNELDVRKIKWFKQTQRILSDSVELELDCIIETYIGVYDEIKMIKDLLIDVSPYYNEELKKLYLKMAVEFDKAYQGYYYVLNAEV